MKLVEVIVSYKVEGKPAHPVLWLFTTSHYWHSIQWNGSLMCHVVQSFCEFAHVQNYRLHLYKRLSI